MEDNDQNPKPDSNSPPPPYDQHRDSEDFSQFDTISTGTLPGVVLVQPQPQPTSATSSHSHTQSLIVETKTPPPMPQTNEIAKNYMEGSQSQAENSNDESIFQKPPKFLLYPVTDAPVQDQKSGEFKDVGHQSPHQQVEDIRFGHGQNHLGVPPVFSANSNQVIHERLEALQGPHPPEEFMPRHSHRAMCPHCQIPVVTETEYINGTLTHLAAFACCWLCCCCFCIPYFINELKDVEHYCPHCNNILGYNHKHVC